MPLVAIDSNVVDLLVDAFDTEEANDAAEAQRERLSFGDGVERSLRRELMAAYWIRTMARCWTSTLYTFCDLLLGELDQIPNPSRRSMLLGLALEMRAEHPEYYCIADLTRMPPVEPLLAAGVKSKDAEHLAVAVGLEADVFLTNDRRLIKACSRSPGLVGLAVEKPSRFLVRAVRSGAPWPTGVDWPWASLPPAA